MNKHLSHRTYTHQHTHTCTHTHAHVRAHTHTHTLTHTHIRTHTHSHTYTPNTHPRISIHIGQNVFIRRTISPCTCIRIHITYIHVLANVFILHVYMYISAHTGVADTLEKSKVLAVVPSFVLGPDAALSFSQSWTQVCHTTTLPPFSIYYLDPEL